MAEKQPTDEIEILEHSIYNVMWAEQKKGEQLLKEHNLTMPQFLVLVSLVRRGGECPIGKLAEELFQSSPTMTGIVDRLVDANLVARERAGLNLRHIQRIHRLIKRERNREKRGVERVHLDDRRQVIVSLTSQGKELLARARAARRARMRRALGKFSARDRKEFLRLLSGYLDALAKEPE